MSTPLPSISPELARIAPGFRALSIYVKAAPLELASGRSYPTERIR